MSLRVRLAVGMLLAALPLLAGLWWLRGAVRTQSLDESLRDFAVTWMEAGGRTRCEEDPQRFVVDTLAPVEAPRGPRPFAPGGPGAPGRGRGPAGGPAGGPGPGPPPRPPHPGEPMPPAPGPIAPGTRLWAYDAQLSSANARAPTLEGELRAALLAGKTWAAVDAQVEASAGRRAAVRMSWTQGPCAVVLVERPYPDLLGADRTLLWGAALLCGGLLLAVLLAAGPIVRRTRRMTQAVLSSAQERYVQPIPVEGGDEIAALGRAFNSASQLVRKQVEQIEQREQTLRSFVANTTHDVLLPLTVLQGHLVALKGQAEARHPADATVLRHALEESHYLGCIIGNLSTAAKLEAGDVHLDLAPVDLCALVERVLARHLPIAVASGVRLDDVLPPEPVRALGDVTLLEQALSNIVHNAVRYNRAGGRVAVVLEAPRNEALFVLRVLDDGPGIAREELGRVMEQRYRGRDARTRAPDGAGLGLWIARDVALRHGFELTLISPAGPPAAGESTGQGPGDPGPGLEVQLRGARLA